MSVTSQYAGRTSNSKYCAFKENQLLGCSEPTSSTTVTSARVITIFAALEILHLISAVLYFPKRNYLMCNVPGK